jgi:hypothetical protein
MDLVVQDDEDALAARLGTAGDLQRVDKVGAGVAAKRAGRPLRPNQHDRSVDAQRQVQEKRGLFERCGAVRNDKSGEAGVLATVR